jgi:hypothetical protein
MKIENVAVISLSDYEEYQELKRKKEIDFSRLRTGSIVKINYNGSQISEECDSKKEVQILSINDGFVVNRLGSLSKVAYKRTLNVIQEGYKISSFASNGNQYYITEVIEY